VTTAKLGFTVALSRKLTVEADRRILSWDGTEAYLIFVDDYDDLNQQMVSSSSALTD
jgi:hypothetical protein